MPQRSPISRVIFKTVLSARTSHLASSDTSSNASTGGGDAVRSRDNGGAGIGLTISKALIEAHGGTLTATSSGPGRGAVFALRLPLSPPDSEEAAR